ncbi:hypothetical protein, partial [Vibrio navarrensis]|uniref:hypothetical protein n=1 Tax=Vibrio navarrensis TaxID=29495 RepID=UPI001EE3D7C8
NKEAVASSIWLLFFLLECDSKLTHYHPNWLNFNSDNYPARGGRDRINSIISMDFVSVQNARNRAGRHDNMVGK